MAAARVASPPPQQLSAGEREWLDWARSTPAGPREAARYREPAFDGARAPSKAEAAARELHDAQQALTKAMLREGDGGDSPRDDDEVLLHLTVRSADEEEHLILSTRAAEGGRDLPLRAVLGEQCALLRGVELALAVFTRGERAVLRLPPEFAYGHACCAARGLQPPRGVSAKLPVFCDVELLDFRRVVTDQGGLITKRILREGDGLETPHAPYEVVVSVAASLPAAWPSGEVAATSSPAPPAPPSAAPAVALWAPRELRAALGAGALPSALEAAVSSMRPGERAVVWLSPACGLRPAPALPQLPESAPDGLELVLELVSMRQVRDLHGDGSLLKTRTSPGVGDFPVDCPIHDCRVRVHIATFVVDGGTRTLLADTRGGEPAQFELATGAQPPGLESALRLMLPGESALVRAAARHAYEAQPCGRWARPPGLPPGANVEWELTLVGFERPLNWYHAETADILADAARSKAAGVELYRAGAWALARARFEALAAKLGGLRGLEGADEETAVASLRAACLLNAAAAAQKLGHHADAVARCTEVLHKLDDSSAKALYRRAVSRTALGDWQGAQEDLDAARVADPSAAADCDRQAAKLRAAQREDAATQRARLGGFLSRPATGGAAAAE